MDDPREEHRSDERPSVGDSADESPSEKSRLLPTDYSAFPQSVDESVGASAPPSVDPFQPPRHEVPKVGRVESLRRWTLGYFGTAPGFWQAMVPLMFLSVILYTRLPSTNYIFDEQEALLANPYVNASSLTKENQAAKGLRFSDAVHRDFWGLPADRSVGSYRPIPNFLWRALWPVFKQPFFHHFYNVLFHAANGAILAALTFTLTRRRTLAWMAGAIFVACAVLTEAVSGIVGIADVLGGMSALLALAALCLPAWAMPFGVFGAILFGLFCKESALVCVPLVPFAALLLAPLTHPERPARFVRMLLALAGSAIAFVLYVELRKRWFLSPLPAELSAELPADASRMKRLSHDFLVWFHQAPLPKDPLNNPLAEADTPHRVAGALRVYWRGLVQVVFPKTLSGDYSFPQEPIPDRRVFPESIAGAAMTVLPPLASLGLWITALVRERRARGASSPIAPTDEAPASDAVPIARRPAMQIAGAILLVLAAAGLAYELLVLRPRGFVGPRAAAMGGGLAAIGVLAIGLLTEGRAAIRGWAPSSEPVPSAIVWPIFVAIGVTWIVVSYFPHSNIPVVLPTVRAERFWYFPAIGSSLVLAVVFSLAVDSARNKAARRVVWAAFAAFIGFQCVQAYRHAMDYRDDVVFWEATKNAVPMSAKAHLNYSVMKGARGDLSTRLGESTIAMDLAPKWPMAHVYTGDTLCRMHRPDEAWPHYAQGFDLGPNELSLIALALQCLHDEGKLSAYEQPLRSLADKHPGSWIAYLAVDTLDNHEKNKGVDPKYRPRGYNEGPKDGE